MSAPCPAVSGFWPGPGGSAGRILAAGVEAVAAELLPKGRPVQAQAAGHPHLVAARPRADLAEQRAFEEFDHLLIQLAGLVGIQPRTDPAGDRLGQLVRSGRRLGPLAN